MDNATQLVADLKATKRLVNRSNRWTKNEDVLKSANGSRGYRYCIDGAAQRATGAKVRHASFGVFLAGQDFAGCKRYGAVVKALNHALPAAAKANGSHIAYNDNPETSHWDIMVLCDRAIAKAEAKAPKPAPALPMSIGAI